MGIEQDSREMPGDQSNVSYGALGALWHKL